jgi:hypothetical protein
VKFCLRYFTRALAREVFALLYRAVFSSGIALRPGRSFTRPAENISVPLAREVLAHYFTGQCSVFSGVSCETHETAGETHAIPKAGLCRLHASTLNIQRFNPSGRSGRLKLRLARGSDEVLHDLGLHALNLETVTARDRIEFRRPGGLAQIRQPTLERLDSFLSGLVFLIVGNHDFNSTIPRLVPPRLTCQYAMNSSTLSPISSSGRIQNALTP